MVRPIVAIGGPHGSGKSSVAKKLAETLDMNYISAGSVFRKMAVERGLTLEEFSEVVVNEPEIDREIDRRTLELGKKDNSIIDAQLAAHFTPKDIAIKISITASPEVRWKRIAKRDKLSLDEAKTETMTRESTERNRFNSLYEIDVLDQSAYDIIINTDRLNQDETYNICETIVRFILNK